LKQLIFIAEKGGEMYKLRTLKIILSLLLIIIVGNASASLSESLAESDHPYANSFEKTWTIKEPGAAKIRLHFEYLKLAKSENPFFGYDSLILLDKYGNELKAYEAMHYDISYQDLWTDWYPGDTLQVKLLTDKSRVYDGFIIDKKEIKQDEGITTNSFDVSNYLAESDHPYQNNYKDEWTIKEPGAANIRLHFKYLKLAKSENPFLGYDKLTIFDKFGNTVKTYEDYDNGLSLQDFWTDWYPGDTLQVKLLTDGTRICDGFIIDNKEGGSNETNTSTESTGNLKSTESEVQSDDTNAGETKILTSTELNSSVNPSEFGQPVTLTARVDTPSHEEEPLGTVTFMDRSTLLGTVDLISGQATLPITSLTTGLHSITAKYKGDGNCKSSTSSALTLTIREQSNKVNEQSVPKTQEQLNVPKEQSGSEQRSLIRDVITIVSQNSLISTIVGGLVVSGITILVENKKKKK
jgi:hypothetical protein